MKATLVSTPPSEVLVGDRIIVRWELEGVTPDRFQGVTLEVPDEKDLSKIKVFRKDRIEDGGKLYAELESTFYAAGEKTIPSMKISNPGIDFTQTEPIKIKVQSSQDGSQDFMQPIPMMEVHLPYTQQIWPIVGLGVGIVLLVSFILYRLFRKKKKKAVPTVVVPKSQLYWEKLNRAEISSKDFLSLASLALRFKWEEQSGVRYSAMTLDEILHQDLNEHPNLNILRRIEELKYRPDVSANELTGLRSELQRVVSV